MQVKRIASPLVLCFAVSCINLGLPPTAFSQAWVPEKGEGSVTITYQKLVGYDHFDLTGARQKVGTDRAQSMSVEFEYGVTDKLAFNADVVYVASKYNGSFPEGPLDFDGRYHPAFQDAHLQVRYNVLNKPLMLTPFVSVTVPTHHYETSGHDATGRDFYELLVGANAGRQLGSVLPNVYVQGRYSYAILKHFAGLNLNRSNLDTEVGWMVTRRLTLRLLGAWQKTYGGLRAPIDFEGPGTEQFEFHDRVLRASYFRLGGGATCSVNRTFDINVGYGGSVSGLNTLAVGGIAIGFSWRFSRGSSISKFHE
ncbi:MAG TPA: hypothetical protein VGA01_12680 [Candidatus Binatia bacterium]